MDSIAPDPQNLKAWLGYVESLPWVKGQLDHCGWLAAVRAHSLRIDSETAFSEIARRIEEAGDWVKDDKIASQIERAGDPFCVRVRGQNNNRLAFSRSYPGRPAGPNPKWPPFDPKNAYRKATSFAWSTLASWNARSLVDLSKLSTFQALSPFYLKGEYFCVGRRKNWFVTLPFHSTGLGDADLFPFVVLNPMRGPWGYKKDGVTKSAKCDGNVKTRRVIVIEFDSKHFDVEAFGLDYFLDIQAMLHGYLATLLPPVLLVHSGNESLHGTYATHGLADPLLRRFMEEAVSIGADRALWVKSQFTRMPGGLSEEGARQQIHYFNPEVIYAAGNGPRSRFL